MVSLLHAIRARQVEQQLEAGELWQDTGYVFIDPEGRPVIPDRVTQDFAAQVRKLGLPPPDLKRPSSRLRYLIALRWGKSEGSLGGPGAQQHIHNR